MLRYLFFLIILLHSTTLFAQTFPLMLLGQYKNQDVTGWVMSEKLDGIRGFWTGSTLLSRQGYPLNPPDYFIKDFPPFAIDGELFSQQDEFESISATIRSSSHKEWYKLKLHVFDVPNADGDLFTRLNSLRQYLNEHPTPYIEIIEQIPIKNPEHIQKFFTEIQKLNGEGIVIRNPNAPYIHGRSAQILKLKAIMDEECTVVAHHRGKGKFKNMLGAITCENERGRFRIGSGFKMKDRTAPPAIDSQITYKYRGLTQSGKPRFATFWRVRNK
ncbi:DNA ligase [Vespertiliibacter pulmonis]|uniref:DNA ligase-1 n=1 Tax=Vespertiliibacter pulmonis TaxID=1443036 RepID=A0A3N4VN81_9PAST|nr:DNA ligase [Vespertiliibacter pulmonis]QLB20972.1 DNA ligase [Vespertiliibacter pulmonis]RPE80731.1 DNA ligase-1 [Vespertiliibacter pulmonis]